MNPTLVIRTLVIAATLYACFLTGVLSSHRAYRLGKQSVQAETTLSETAAHQYAHLSRSESFSGYFAEVSSSPSGSFLYGWQADFLHTAAFFFDAGLKQYITASEKFLIRHPRQYIIFPAHYFW